MLIRAGHVDNIEKNIAVNDKYIDAITAKLKILDQIWNLIINIFT